VARRAPAVDRSIAILNHLAARPEQRFTLSEIARELNLNKATLHAMLNALTDAGYLVRDDATKTYGLGPALVALGRAALQASPATALAEPEMEGLAAETGLDVVASAAIHDEIVILARAGTPRPFGVNVQPGQRLPMRPPLGTVFVAWSGPTAIDRWLAIGGTKVSKADLARYRTIVQTVRARGYSVGLEAGSLARRLKGTDHPRSLEEGVRGVRVEEYALLDLDEAESYRLNHIGAPVFGHDGEVTIALFLIGFTGPILAEQVDALAARLCDAAARVTDKIGGRAPAT